MQDKRDEFWEDDILCLQKWSHFNLYFVRDSIITVDELMLPSLWMFWLPTCSHSCFVNCSEGSFSDSAFPGIAVLGPILFFLKSMECSWFIDIGGINTDLICKTQKHALIQYCMQSLQFWLEICLYSEINFEKTSSLFFSSHSSHMIVNLLMSIIMLLNVFMYFITKDATLWEKLQIRNSKGPQRHTCRC